MDHLLHYVDGAGINFPQIQLRQDLAAASSSSSQPPNPNVNPALYLLPATPTTTLHHHASSSSSSAPLVAAADPPTPAAAAVDPSTAAAAVAPSTAAAAAPPAPPRLPEHLMHKNRLQEFAQRSNIALPMYQTINEGSPHAPRFRSTVRVDGMSYTSQVTFSQRKAAEQDVARLAFENLSNRIKEEECPLVSENTWYFSKSILNEYATKMNLERPTYDTVQLEGSIPFFQSYAVFNGTKYTGDAARNKKEAEQLAARSSILSILGGSNPGTLYEIIKSKTKIYAAVKSNKSQCTDANTVAAIANTGHASSSLEHKDKEVASLVAANNDVAKIELPVSSKMHSSCQEFQTPEYVPSAEATKLTNIPLQPGGSVQPGVSVQPVGSALAGVSGQPAGSVQPGVSVQPGGSEQGEQAIGNGSSSKKRRKNKKKANKKSRLESPVPLAVIPCSLAQ